MGVDLSPLVEAHERELKDFTGKKIAIDGYNALYQFLSIIRQPDGTPLRDREGRITSHLAGLLYRTANMVEVGIRPVYVFDGKPPEEKQATIEERREIREKALEEWQMALAAGDMETARTKAQQSSRLTKDMVADAKQLLRHLGIPYVDAPSEGEAQASHMAKKGDVWAVGSQDYDCLVFGAPILVRNLTVTGRRKLPRKKVYVEVRPEEIHLDEVLKKHGITWEQLVDIAILVGTDFNPGVKGVGPKTALKLIKEHGNIEKALEKKEMDPGDFNRVREIFMKPNVTDDYSLEWRPPDRQAVTSFLCGQRDFSETRVSGALDRMEQAYEKNKQASLDRWF